MKPDDKQPKMPLAQRFVEHLARRFGEPIVKSTEKGRYNRPDQNVVEMRHHKIRVMQLPVPWGHSKHDARQPSDQELKQKCKAEQHRRGKYDLASPHGRQPVEDFYASRDAYQHAGCHEERDRGTIQTDGKHMVRPDTETDKADPHRSGYHGRVAENGLAGKYRNNFAGDPKSRKRQNVHLRMTEDPEEMH